MKASMRVVRVFGASAVIALALTGAFGVGGLVTEQAKLVAGDAQYGDRLGFAVAVSGDTVVAGQLSARSDAGAAYVFARSGTTWSGEAKLIPADGANGAFGISAAISGDTAVVGATYQDLYRGAAYVFTRTGTAWSEQAKLVAADAATDDRLGISVAVSGDTAVAGAHQRGTSRGAAYVFVRTGAAWSQQAVLTASDAADYDHFGICVAVSGDTLVVGAPNHVTNRGAVYVFRRTGTSWSEQAKLSAADAAAGDQLGLSVAISGDTLVAGAPTKGTLQGAAYVFTRTGSAWAEQAKLTASDAVSGDLLGTSVGVAGDTVVAGAYGKDGAQGAAYVFTRDGLAWSETSRIAATDGAGSDDLGFSVGVSAGTAVVGAWGKDGSKGAAYVISPLAGAVAPPGYCLPSRVTARENSQHPERSALTASGVLDTGIGAPDFSGAATFDIGGFHLDVPAFVAKGRSLSYAAGGVALRIKPAKSGSSRATFSVSVLGDLAGRVGLSAPLSLRFKNAAHDVKGSVQLASGKLRKHCLLSPDLCVVQAAATLKGAGKDSFRVTLGFATDGVAPELGERETAISFGGAYESPVLPIGSFVRRRDAYVYTGKAPGLTSVVIDYAKGTIDAAASRIDLGAFADGGNDVTVRITRGRQVQVARIRMTRSGTKLVY